MADCRRYRNGYFLSGLAFWFYGDYLNRSRRLYFYRSLYAALQPAKTERFQTLSPHLATHTMGEEEEVYGVGDIGPDFPPEHEIAPVYGVGDIGPDFPPEQLQITTDKKDE